MAVEHGDGRKVDEHTVQVVRAKLIVRDKCGFAQWLSCMGVYMVSTLQPLTGFFSADSVFKMNKIN